MDRSYSALQKKVDQLIHKLGGSQNVVDFLDSIMSKDTIEEQVSSFITLSVVNRFSITVDDIRSESKSNAKPRSVC